MWLQRYIRSSLNNIHETRFCVHWPQMRDVRRVECRWSFARRATKQLRQWRETRLGSAFAGVLRCRSSLGWNDHTTLLASRSPSRKGRFATMNIVQTASGLPVRLLIPATILVVAGCASSGPKPGEFREANNGAEAGKVQEAAQEIPSRALTLFEQATAIMAAGDFVDAELRFKEFLLQYPAYPGAYVNLAIIHAENGNEPAVQAAIDAALRLNPAHPAALNQQGMLFRRNGKFIEAEAAYLKAVTASPDYALAHYNLGVLNELYLQRLEAALQHFVQYQSLVDDDAQVGKWISDLTRRVAARQRTANVAE